MHPWRAEMSPQSRCPACKSLGGLRVDVVWFGEVPYHMEEIYGALAACDLFLAIGTSGQVYPAAGFVKEVRYHGRARAVELNLEPSDSHGLFDEGHYGPAGEVVPAFVAELLGEN